MYILRNLDVIADNVTKLIDGLGNHCSKFVILGIHDVLTHLGSGC